VPEGSKGPIFEDGPAFDSAYNLFHGKDGLLPLSGRSIFRDDLQDQTSLQVINSLAGKVATISLSAFGPGGPFSFGPFSDKFKKQQHKKPNKQHSGDSSKHEAVGDEWLKTGHCPIAKSYNAASKVMPLVAKALQPPPDACDCSYGDGCKRTSRFLEGTHHQVLAFLVCGGSCCHPFIAMLRKSVLMPKTAMFDLWCFDLGTGHWVKSCSCCWHSF
ncbi:hypothetical protein DY000_02056264, partial [Brassica cretica]